MLNRLRIALNGKLPKSDADVQLENARILYQTGIEAQPTSFQALTGLSIVSLLQGKVKDGVKYGEAAVAANPNYAGGHYALAAAYSDSSKAADSASKGKLIGMSQQANLKAGLLDKPNLQGREVPDGKAVFRYFETGGRTMVITMPR